MVESEAPTATELQILEKGLGEGFYSIWENEIGFLIGRQDSRVPTGKMSRLNP